MSDTTGETAAPPTSETATTGTAGPAGGPAPGAASHDVKPPEPLVALMQTGWAPREDPLVEPDPAAALRAGRRAALAQQFPREWVVVPTGRYRTRSNDTDYRFRPGTDFVYLVGSHEPEAVLVLDPDGGQTLYQAPTMDRGTPEFFTDRTYGELWVGPRPSLTTESARLGIACRPLAELEELKGTVARVLRGLDATVEEMFVALPDPEQAEQPESAEQPEPAAQSAPALKQEHADGEAPAEQEEQPAPLGPDGELAEFLSRLRVLKDEHEITQLQEAVDATVTGFEDVVRALGAARRTSERWLEGVFALRARVAGNDVGYGSICAAGSHACTLHWTGNDGPVRDGDLVLLDMGVEGRELYTADVTRTLPVSGRFTDRQREVYDLVFAAQEAALAECRPGVEFLAPHRAAMRVLAHGLQRFGVLEDAEAALAEDTLTYRRWTLHGVSHMLGLDVHDCARARMEDYRKGHLQPGVVLTVEPGLYFQPDDLLVPADLRGIGVRIEDDILITADGHRNLSAALPRSSTDVESWLAQITGSSAGQVEPTPGA